MTRMLLVGFRWSARATGLILTGLLLLLAIGEGLPNPLRQPLPVQVEFAAMFLMLAGFVAGWRREALGGTLAVGGFIVFAATELIVNGRLPGGAIPLYLIPGVLFLTAAGLALAQRRAGRRSTPSPG